MKTLTIGSTTLELNSFSKKWDKIAGVFAEISIPTTAISHEELKALFTDNAEDLIVTAEDGSTETFSGYAELHSIKEDIANGVYIVVQFCTSTALHLLNEARKQIATLELEKTELQGKVDTQATEINSLNMQLLMVQMAAADLYEKSLVTEETTEEPEESEVQ